MKFVFVLTCLFAALVIVQTVFGWIGFVIALGVSGVIALVTLRGSSYAGQVSAELSDE